MGFNMNKAYIIVHDGENVLIGKGGRSGKWKNVRRGYHLSGGTIDGSENVRVTVLRELKEEMGIDLDESAIESDNIKSDKAPTVTFVVAKVESVEKLVQDFIRPPLTKENEFDEPFEQIISLKSKDSWKNENFNPNFYTDWFAHGLYAARSIIAPE